jgi:hypothetical protein
VYEYLRLYYVSKKYPYFPLPLFYFCTKGPPPKHMAEHLGRIYSAQSFTIIGAPIPCKWTGNICAGTFQVFQKNNSKTQRERVDDTNEQCP